jgi:hypothetical protein
LGQFEHHFGAKAEQHLHRSLSMLLTATALGQNMALGAKAVA